jgi:DNA/RNA endonuclease YhcR with UshA esterase domain
MKTALVLAVAFLFTINASLVRADVITAAQAAQHVGEVQTVRGIVASATYSTRAKGQPTFLNLDKPYPDAIFTVVIWGSDRGKFTAPPEKAFQGKTVRVTGKITAYKGTPEIAVHDPTQIVIEGGNQDSP